MPRRVPVLLAVCLSAAAVPGGLAVAQTGGTGDSAASSAQPSTRYSGKTYYKVAHPMSLTTDETARKVTVVPGLWQKVKGCRPAGWSGEIFSTDMSNDRKLPIGTDGRFRGRGRSELRIASDDPRIIVAVWTVKGRFTSSTSAAGTLRIRSGMRPRKGAPEMVRCPYQKVRWRTTRTTPLESDRRG